MAREANGIKIGELVKRAEVTRATIHHYVHEGLLPEPVKTSRNMALYDPDCVERILLVKGLQKQQRRSLAEVKSLLEGAKGHEGLVRLREQLLSDAAREEAFEPGRGESIAEDALAARTGFTPDDITALEHAGVIAAKRRGGHRVFDTLDADVVDALSRLSRAGFDRAHGFEAKHVAMYVDAMRSLLQKEVSLFLETVRADENAEQMFARARSGIEHVTSLLLALRRKLLRELLDAASIPEQAKHDAKKKKAHR